MNSLYDEDEEETKARAATTCPGCGVEKDKGLVVCWTCFKKPGGYKYSDSTLSAWLAAQRAAKKQRYIVEQFDTETYIVADTQLNREVCVCGAFAVVRRDGCDGDVVMDGFTGGTPEGARRDAERIASLLNTATA